MKTFRVSGHFSVGGLELPFGRERELRVMRLENILKEGLSKCTTIEGFVLARQMRPWNLTKLEPDLVEEITIKGEDHEAVFTVFKNDPGHLAMVEALRVITWAKWSIVVYELPS